MKYIKLVAIGLVTLSLGLTFSTAGIIGLQNTSVTLSSSAQISGGFLLDRQITWNDGTQEHIQLGRDGYIYINGTKRVLVGFELGTTGPISFWDPTDLALINKELAYLQSIGVRVISLDLYYVGLNNEQSRYSPILNLLYQHKMLVFPVITGKDLEGSENLTNPNFNIFSVEYGNDTMQNWVSRWVSVVSQYNNVIAISAENELDSPSSALCTLTQQLSNYFTWLVSDLRNITTLPITSKTVYNVGADDTLKDVILSEVDFVTTDTYSFNLTDDLNRLSLWASCLQTQNKSTVGWWTGELNIFAYENSSVVVDTPDFNSSYIQAALNYGSSVIFLWTMNRNSDPSEAFFDTSGNPTPVLQSISSYVGQINSQQIT